MHNRAPMKLPLLCGLLVAGCSDPVTPAAARCSITPPALATGRLTTDGTALRDELGRVVSLRGFNAGSRSKFAPFVPFDFTDGQYEAALGRYLDLAAGWGVDVLRVPFVWAAVEPVRDMDDAVFLARYDALLDGAWKRGMRTIVDFHQDVYADVYCGDGFPAWTLKGPLPAPHHDCPRWFEGYTTPQVSAAFDAFWAPNGAVQADYVALWQRVVAREKDRAGVVGFELLNEPSAGTADESTFEATTLTDFYSRLVPTVNAMAPGALVFVDPPGLTSATHSTKMKKVAGANVVFAPHYYQPLTIFDGDGRPDLVLPELTALVHIAGAWNVPAFLGEWGAARDAAGSADLVAAHHAAFDALAIGGTQWEYSLTTEVWNDEKLDVASSDGSPNPMVAGMLRPHARAVAAPSATASFDEAARRYSLTFAASASGSVSEIALPAGAYPGGYRIQLQGACVDDSAPGRLYLKADGSGPVSLEIAPN